MFAIFVHLLHLSIILRPSEVEGSTNCYVFLLLPISPNRWLAFEVQTLNVIERSSKTIDVSSENGFLFVISEYGTILEIRLNPKVHMTFFVSYLYDGTSYN